MSHRSTLKHPLYTFTLTFLMFWALPASGRASCPPIPSPASSTALPARAKIAPWLPRISVDLGNQQSLSSTRPTQTTASRQARADHLRHLEWGISARWSVFEVVSSLLPGLHERAPDDPNLRCHVDSSLPTHPILTEEPYVYP